jgi:hypothetical protein
LSLNQTTRKMAKKMKRRRRRRRKKKEKERKQIVMDENYLKPSLYHEMLQHEMMIRLL